ncbi:nucleoporin autopeptidase-domain-containing protein [Jimgerdemannia flammicorona]|uniref:Nucleoporin autopeptidase-domain-containing protein n=1 Tax=Jimgerdemannia flammicorona TaxID=994334 RepID=A0A433D1T0_9FUNG|nr:nucleoporin autopeptidase-domain-containing protein [Jimgerdemannia flammicorona]
MFGGFGSTGFGQQPQPQQQQQQQQQPSSLFGQTTNPQPGFGGFGATAAPTAFGQQTTNTGAFGQPSTSASPFGATTSTGPTPASTAASSGFGFGSSTATAPAFGSTPSATGGLFGSRPAQNSAFGTTTNTGVFGQAAPTTSAFGSSNTSAFPATNTLPAGTSNPPYSVTNERDQATGTNNAFHSISAMPAYKNYSFEELRLQDYQQGRKTASGTSTGFGTTSGVFGATSTGSAFGQAAPATSTSLFGTSATPFGQTQPQTGFGQTGTTGFGASTGTTGGLFGSSTGTSTGMFGSSTQTQQPTSAFGGTGAFGTSGTAFGSTGGAFGAQAAKPTSFGFGSTSTTQPTTAFGATTPAFGQTGPTTTGNMFGTTTNPSGAFGATTQPGSSFGFGQSVPTSQPAATSFGGFSAQPTQQKPPASFSFGGSTPAPATGSFGGLGTQQPQTSKPTFSFGSGSATTFGTAPQTSGFLGQTSTAAPATGLTFGATPAQSTAFGTAAAPTTSFGSTLFSNKATAPLAGGLFSGTPAPQPSAFSFGTQPAATTAFPPLGQNTLLSSTSQTQQASIAASIDKNPYGNNPLFDGASTGATTTPPSATIVASAGKKKPAMTPHFKIAARSTAKVRLRGFGTSSSPLNGSATSNGLGRSLHFFDGVNDDSVLSPDTLVPRQSVKKLVIDRCINEEEILTSVDASNISDSPFVVSNGKGKAPASSTRPRVTFNPNLEVAAAETFYLSTPSSSVTYGSTNVTPIKRLDLTATSPDISASTPSPVNGILSAEGEYWTSPTLESLRRLSPEELAQVKDFRVGLTGYGQISFVAPVDLTGVASLRAVAGNIVIFERRACTVYPDEATKPPRGQGLNVPAVISLDQCWPIDKATRQPILDQDHPRYQQHVAKLRKIPETEFIDFRAEKGTWVFKVQHFSRYGLDYNDSDDENDEIDEAQMEAARQKLRRLKGEDDADDAPPAQSMASLVSNSNANVRYRAPGDSSDEWFPSADEEDSAMIMTVDEDSSVPEDTFQQTSTENRASFKVETEDEEQEEDDLGPFDGEDEMDVEEGYDMDESDFENRPPRSSSRSRDSATTNEIGAVLDISDPNWQPPKHSMTHPEYLRLEARRVQVMQATFFPPEEKKPAVVPRSRGVAIAVSALGKRTQTAITVPESDDEVEEDEVSDYGRWGVKLSITIA